MFKAGEERGLVGMGVSMRSLSEDWVAYFAGGWSSG